MTEQVRTIAATPEPVRTEPSSLRESSDWLIQRCVNAIRKHTKIISTIGTSFAVFVLQAVQGILLARILGPEGRGEYATAMFFTQLLIFIGLLGTLYSIARRAASHQGGLNGLRRVSLRLGATTGLLTMAVVFLLSLVALPADRQYLAPLCMFCALLLPFEHMRLTLLAVDHGSGNFSGYNAGQFVAALVLPAMLLVVWMTDTGTTSLATILAVIAPAIGLGFVLLRRQDRVKTAVAAPSQSVLVKEGMPYAVSVVASNMFNRIDMFLIIWFASLTTQGYYVAAIAAANLLAVAPNAMALFSFNSGARQQRHASLRTLITTGASVAMFQLATALAFAAVLPLLITVFFGESFHGAIILALALLPAKAMAGFAHVAEGYLRGRNESIVGVWARVFGAVVMIVCFFALRNQWDTLSVPLAALVGNLGTSAWICCAVVRDVKRQQQFATTEAIP